MTNQSWDSRHIPDQKGKTIVITGASSGLGKEATKVLAAKNAKVIMAVRNPNKAQAIAAQIISEVKGAQIEIKVLDLTSLASIQEFADTLMKEVSILDVLINNAGIMMCPFSKTKDGLEIQMATNHFGHFALTGLLMPLLKRTKDSRIVVTSSIAHKTGDINFEDINWKSRKYDTNKAYCDSKLANLYFMHELVERLKSDSESPIVTCAHPGWTKTSLDRHSSIASFLGNIVAQKVDMGTLPSLRAATDMEAHTGDYFGPKGILEMRGYPVLVSSNEMANNKENAKKLWALSEELTGVRY